MGDSGEINLTIEDQGEGTKVFSFQKDKTIKDLIEYYLKEKTQSKYVSFDPKTYIFKYGAILLNRPKFLNKNVGNILKNNSVIKLYRKNENSFTNYN